MAAVIFKIKRVIECLLLWCESEEKIIIIEFEIMAEAIIAKMKYLSVVVVALLL